MFSYTGHPFYDVGVAAVLALVEKWDPADLNDEDLDKAASFMEKEYIRDPLKSFLGVAFTSNAWFNQPSFAKHPEKKLEYARKILRGYDSKRESEHCVFTGLPVTGMSFSDKLPPGRAFRQHIPLLTGEGVINFYPWGDAGLPVSGIAALCLQAFPLGCAKCGGRLLAVHSNNPDLITDFAREFLRENLQAMVIAQQAGSSKLPESGSTAKTLLIRKFLEIEGRRQDEAGERRPCSVTAYHLTNSGQSNALDERNSPLEIYHLPLEMTSFLISLQSPLYRHEWKKITDRAWRLAQVKKRKRQSAEGNGDTRPACNYLYEDLFRLPDNAAAFIRSYLLRLPDRTKRDDDPRRYYSISSEADLVSWNITELFLRKVMGVEQKRIEQISELGDRLASYVSGENDRRFFMTFYSVRNYEYFRTALIKANLNQVRRGNPPLITLNPFIEIFEEGNDVARPDWRLARDLVLIRMIEQLYHTGWLGRNRDLLPETETQSEEPAAEAVQPEGTGA